MKELPVANRPVDGERLWNQVRAAYPKQQPLLDLNNAAVSPPPLQVDKFDHWSLGTYGSAIQAGIAPAIRFHKEIGTQAIHARPQQLSRYWRPPNAHTTGYRRAGAGEPVLHRCSGRPEDRAGTPAEPRGSCEVSPVPTDRWTTAMATYLDAEVRSRTFHRGAQASGVQPVACCPRLPSSAAHRRLAGGEQQLTQ